MNYEIIEYANGQYGVQINYGKTIFGISISPPFVFNERYDDEKSAREFVNARTIKRIIK